MGKIIVLPDTLCNQIAAGEVVERPAAVVKELMENSIDAGCRRLSVSHIRGGRREIRVVDNGTGMSQDDALLALERHATSKLRTAEDLHSIQSLGFRGEALPSIAAVSRFEMTTREPEALSGTLIRMEGGILKDVRTVGSPPGTMITVRDIFFNLPPRRSFLRTVDTESAHIGEQFLRLAMAHPEIHFQLTAEERRQYDFPLMKTYQARAAQILGTDVTARLREFSAQTSSLRLHGLAGPPEVQRSNSQSIFAYVNGRPVWDRTLNHAVLNAYDSLIPRGRFPLLVLFVHLPPELVDVNVHPTKREVRFRSPGEILDTVRSTIRATLGLPYSASSSNAPRYPSAPGLPLASPVVPHIRETRAPFDAPRPVEPDGLSPWSARVSPPVQMEAGSVFRPSSSSPLPSPAEIEEECPSAPEPPQEPGLSQLPVLGQMANTYLLLEAPDALILVDQHAAHERIVFESLMGDGVPTRKEPAQRLVKSVVLELLPKDASTLRRWIPHLASLGFGIEAFGGNSFVIDAVPAALGAYPPEALLRGLIETAHEDESSPGLGIAVGLARTAACHGAVRAGQKLHPEEIRHLLATLDRTPMATTCPHGRPVWVKISRSEIARMFQRT